MKLSGAIFDKLLGGNHRARSKEDVDHLKKPFNQPIIHRQIHSSIYVH